MAFIRAVPAGAHSPRTLLATTLGVPGAIGAPPNLILRRGLRA